MTKLLFLLETIVLLAVLRNVGAQEESKIPPPQTCEEIRQVIRIKCPENTQVDCQECRASCSNFDCLYQQFDFPQCVCLPGYVREYDNPSAPCIPQEKCPQRSCEEIKTLIKIKCPENSYIECSGCNESCQNGLCVYEKYDFPQCVCQPGYVREFDYPSAPCIPMDKCPACEDVLPLILILCIENAQVGCIGCDRTCEQVRQNVQCRPGRVPFPQCFCQPGYFKLNEDPSSPCVPLEECPLMTCDCKDVKKKEKACGCNEEAKCSGCDERCQSWYEGPCTERYYDDAYCFCKEGYIRFADGNCKKREECQLRG